MKIKISLSLLDLSDLRILLLHQSGKSNKEEVETLLKTSGYKNTVTTEEQLKYIAERLLRILNQSED